MFYVDDQANELVLMISKDAKTIRLKIGEGIAGWVAQSGETLIVDDAYQDPRFSRDFDMSAGYKTTTLMATPIRDYDGEIVAVLQAINKNFGVFTPEDKILIENIGIHTGIVLRNTQLYQTAMANEKRVNSILDMVKTLHSDVSVHSLLFTISKKAQDLTEADKVTLFLVDPTHEQLVVMQSELNTRLSIHKGIAGYVARTGKIVNDPDAYDDPNFNKEFDIKTGYRTKQVLCMPMLAPSKKVIGVIQLMNRADDSPFNGRNTRLPRCCCICR